MPLGVAVVVGAITAGTGFVLTSDTSLQTTPAPSVRRADAATELVASHAPAPTASSRVADPSPAAANVPEQSTTEKPFVLPSQTAVPRIPPKTELGPTPPALDAVAALPAFDAAVHSLLERGYPGGSLAIVRDGKLVYARGYGSARPGVPATATTRYRQASISKAVTGSLLASLVAKGTLSLDLRVFPFLGVAPADSRANAITVRMLRDHRSGFAADYFLSEPRKAAAFYGVTSPPDPDTMVRWTARHMLATDPGATYRYNNTDYALLSRVIERATGRAWIDLVTDLTKPLGIGSWRLGASLARPADEPFYYEAEPYRYVPSVFDSAPGTVENPYGGYDAALLSGAVALVSTVIDMARFDHGIAMGAIPAPEEKPIPTSPGWSYQYIYNGSMPGHYTFAMRIWNGTTLTVIAGAFNHRDAGPIDASINQRMLDAYVATRSWPTVDLFPRY